MKNEQFNPVAGVKSGTLISELKPTRRTAIENTITVLFMLSMSGMSVLKTGGNPQYASFYGAAWTIFGLIATFTCYMIPVTWLNSTQVTLSFGQLLVKEHPIPTPGTSKRFDVQEIDGLVVRSSFSKGKSGGRWVHALVVRTRKGKEVFVIRGFYDRNHADEVLHAVRKHLELEKGGTKK